ncbi:MFS transporter [Curtobacterium flaccumfaciens pv. oortii]|nr:MFS transporter [Curtobacterium flaccumfaciens]MBT1621447.1 MFS transporter [Curtobacterium flaccumfaciens pv. oortii]
MLGLVALVLQLAMLPRIPAQQQVRFATLASLLRVPRARVGLIAAAFLFAAQFAAYTYIAPYLQDLVGVGPDTVTLALLVFGVAGIVGNFAAGFTLGRSVLGTISVSKVALAVAVVLLPLLAHSVVGVFVLLVVWGLVWGALPLGMQTWMSTASPAGSETGLALFVTTIQLAIAAGSVLGGAAVSSFGLAADFWLSGGVAVVGAIVLVSLGLRRSSAAPVADEGPAPAPVPTSTGSVAVACP